ncbi:MAG TPA: DUF3108 domain-containing protein [Thermodesulfovibrionia bacterium]|nr:DUF3108 domain-containing protein [Thermodesulfovibrionia bacterium]
MKRVLYLTVVLLLLLLTPLFSAQGDTVAEKLTYQAAYLNAVVGEITISSVNKQSETTLVYNAEINGWMFMAYELNDRIETIIDAGGYPTHYKRIKVDSKGDTIRNLEVLFNNHQITYNDKLKNKIRKYDVTTKNYDLLSGFNAIRKLPLSVGMKESLPVFQKRKFYTASVDVLRTEQVEIPLGKFKTVVVDVKMRSQNPRANNIDMMIWFTDDQKHLPIKIDASLAFGVISLQLTGINKL